MAMKPISVSQLNGYVKRILQTDPLLGNVSVVGEVSNLKFHGSGHVYFSMKDERSLLHCFLPAERAKDLRYQLSEGMEITASGYVYLYERGGRYSLNIRDIEVAGLGNLALAFEELKKKLEAEGLFDQAHKKEIPFFPGKIAVVTSESGAAIRDIVKIIQDKNDYVDVLICPVLVQGDAAAGEIAEAIARINEDMPEVDAIIVGRGGGSMEDLWAFNEEVVARSIFASTIPVISAVGHEQDFTISDFVADRRAETPTAAAHMAVPDVRELKTYVSDLGEQLRSSLDSCLRRKEIQLAALDLTAFQRDLESRVVVEQMAIDNIRTDNAHRMAVRIEDAQKRLDLLLASLQSLNPKAIMDRGYGAIIDAKGALVGNIQRIHPRDDLTLVLKDGQADCTVNRVRRDG